MLFALLALVIMGLIAATILQSRRVEMKRAAGVAEATVLEKLRNGLQGAMYEQFNALQQGLPMSKGTVSVPVSDESGHRVWRPTVAQLRDMGYLPAGWNAERSALNDGPYSLSLRTVPPGCSAVNCDVEAHVVVMRPILDEGRGTPVDGVTIGPILTRTGADGGVSLATRPGVITGFNNAWTLPNPVPGQPAGVLALRIGTESAGFSQFVRVGDDRDPGFRGDLSSAGDLVVGGTVDVGGAVRLHTSLSVGSDGSVPCSSIGADGAMKLGCTGSMELESVIASGLVTANDGISTPHADLFRSSDPKAILLRDSSLMIAGPEGPLLSLSGQTLRVPALVSSDGIELTQSVSEGHACAERDGLVLARLDAGGLAVCIGSKWTVAVRLAVAGDSCGVSGVSAKDSRDGRELICRNGRYLQSGNLMSDFVLMQTYAVPTGGASPTIPKPSCENVGFVGLPLIVITPNNEAAPVSGALVIGGINRYAVEESDHWTIHLEASSTGASLQGNVIATVYCYFGVLS